MTTEQSHVPALDKTSIETHANEFIDVREDSLRKHPLGIKPSGNALTANGDLSLSIGSFRRIPDELLLLVLEYLDKDSLFALSHACKALFAFATYDQIWRELAVDRADHDLTWRGSWRSSVLKLPPLPKIDCRHLFSDALYRPFQCTHASLTPYFNNIPVRNQIKRFHDLSIEEFNRQWSNVPFILTEPVKKWSAFREWDEQSFLERYGSLRFRAEAVDWTFENYVQYMHNNQDESPLYLFDRAFVEKMGLTIGKEGAYEPCECFSDDLFTLLGEHRPDHRWLIIGPERSGSTFHKDPNATSAWNAVIRGSKYWIMFPNSITPPGVYVSDDQGEVTSPLSIVEWLLTFHTEARQIPSCVEGICGAGEVLHVPSGWWHLVVNLEPAIAITQNFVPRTHLYAAVNFLKNKPGQVSGFRETIEDPYALFMGRLKIARPDLHEEVNGRAKSKRKWEDVVAAEDDQGSREGGFSFSFGGDLEDEE